jgi:parvulin-like peptidyl-prolyl isomerase
MKKIILWIILFSFVIVGCAVKKEESIKLEQGSPAYELAKTLTDTLDILDPDINHVFVSTSLFDLTAGDIVNNFQKLPKMYIDQLKQLGMAHLKEIVKQRVEALAVQRIMQHEAEKAKITLTQAEIDSLFDLQCTRSGGKEKFMEFLEKNGISIEDVKKDISDGAVINQYLDDVIAKKSAATQKEIESKYEELKNDTTATVRHILLTTEKMDDSQKKKVRKTMEGILQRAKAGEDFAELAKQYSDDPGSKENGGLYENFKKGTMVKPFEDAAFSIPAGEISDVVETRFGYHIIKVIERNTEIRPLEEVRPEIVKKIEEEKKRSAYTDHIESLKKDYKFSINEF